MVINGSVDIGGDAIILYKDNTSLWECPEYREYGDHVCDDVILVPVNSQQQVRYATVSARAVELCEVQIFAGKSLYYYYYWKIDLYIRTYMCVVSTINCIFHRPRVHSGNPQNLRLPFAFIKTNTIIIMLSIRVCFCLI